MCRICWMCTLVCNVYSFSSIISIYDSTNFMKLKRTSNSEPMKPSVYKIRIPSRLWIIFFSRSNMFLSSLLDFHRIVVVVDVIVFYSSFIRFHRFHGELYELCMHLAYCDVPFVSYAHPRPYASAILFVFILSLSLPCCALFKMRKPY